MVDLKIKTYLCVIPNDAAHHAEGDGKEKRGGRHAGPAVLERKVERDEDKAPPRR